MSLLTALSTKEIQGFNEFLILLQCLSQTFRISSANADSTNGFISAAYLSDVSPNVSKPLTGFRVYHIKMHN